MSEERSELTPRRHEQNAVASFAKASIAIFLVLCLFAGFGSVFGLSSGERKATFNAIVERDLQAIPPDMLQWLDKQQIPIREYGKTVAKIKYEKVISKLHKASKLIKKPATFGLLPENIWKNVRAGCAPYDETRALRNITGFYISASDVLTPEQAYIVGEEPVESTEEIFWRAVVEADVRTIVALVTPPQAAYWDSSRFPKKIQHWKIEKIEEEEEEKSPFLLSHRIVRRLFKLTNEASNESRTVTHFQYENWPDHDAPECTLFNRLLARVDEVHPDSSYPIFVHCAAGVGRSGTFVAAHSLRRDIYKLVGSDGPSYVNIARRVLEMRMQRKRLLSKPAQLRAVVEAVRDAIFKSGMGHR